MSAHRRGLQATPPLPIAEVARATIKELQNRIIAVTSRSGIVSNRESPELIDARAILSSLKGAASVRDDASHELTQGYKNWRAGYEYAFRLLDRHSRYVISLDGTTTTEIAFADDAAAHDALVTRTNAAIAVQADGNAFEVNALLTRYQPAFDAAWAAKPDTAVSDASDVAVALSAEIIKAEQCIDFLEWAREHRT